MENYVEEIESYLLSEKEFVIFNSALKVIESNNDLAFNYFCLSIRELIRVFFESRAPIDKIKECSWYKTYGYDSKAHNQVTTRQRLAYVVCGGIDIELVDEKVEIKKHINELCIVNKNLSEYTHINDILTSEIYLPLKQQIINTLCIFLRKINELRSKICDYYEELFHYAVIEKIISETQEAFLETASQYFDEEVELTEYKIDNITNELIFIEANGVATASVQYCSDSDVKNDIGYRGEYSFPLKALLSIETSLLFDEDVIDSNLEVVNYEINNESFFK